MMEKKRKRGERDINWNDAPAPTLESLLYIDTKCPLIGRIFRSIKQIARVDLYRAKFSTINRCSKRLLPRTRIEFGKGLFWIRFRVGRQHWPRQKKGGRVSRRRIIFRQIPLACTHRRFSFTPDLLVAFRFFNVIEEKWKRYFVSFPHSNIRKIINGWIINLTREMHDGRNEMKLHQSNIPPRFELPREDHRGAKISTIYART